MLAIISGQQENDSSARLKDRDARRRPLEVLLHQHQRDLFWLPSTILVDGLWQSEARSITSEHEKPSGAL